MQRLGGVDEAPLDRPDLDREHLADVALGDEPLQRRVDLERVRRRHELRDEVRRPARAVQHASRLGGVHGHARLAQDVLAGVERRQRDRAVHVRPGADADRVDVRRPHEIAPVVVHPGDPELTGDTLAGLPGAVRDRHQLDAGLRPELRNVMLTRVSACAHESYADRLVDHGAAW